MQPTSAFNAGRAAATKLPPVVPADVSAALFALGIDHVVHDDEASALCPNPDHDDSSPSWSCNLETGMHNCFSCGFGGSFVKLVATLRGVRYGEATAWVKTRRVRRGPDAGEIEREEKPRPEVRESDLWQATDPPAWALAQRKISLEAAREFEIQWLPRKECWVFPIRDPRTDKLLGWQEKNGKIFINRPKDVEKARAVFGMRQLKRLGSGTVTVVESPLDVARFWMAGVTRAVSTYGIEFSDYQIYLLWGYADRLVFAPDNDRAGHRKIARWLSENPYRKSETFVFDYGGTFEDDRDRCVLPEGDGRDPGNLTDRELRQGIEWSSPAWRTYFEGVNWWQTD